MRTQSATSPIRKWAAIARQEIAAVVTVTYLVIVVGETIELMKLILH